MRIPIRMSRLAKWSRRLAAFAMPLLLLSVLLHVFGQIETAVFEICLAMATALAALAALLGLSAYIRLWFTGDRGWSAASFGLVAGALCLVPAGWAVAMMLLYPSTADISTDPDNPPSLVLAAPATDAPPADSDAVRNFFPNLLARSYQVDPEILFTLAQAEIRRRGWTVIESRAPGAGGGQAHLNARRTTLLGWPNEIALQLTPESSGTLVHLRGASLRPVLHDLGENARAIESFLVALDEAVTIYVRENLAILDDEEELPEVIFEDAQETQ